MSDLVVDACVAVKWVVDEEHSERALTLLKIVDSLCAPAHWLAEAGTVLWAKCAIHGLIVPSEMGERIAFLRSLPIRHEPLPDLIEEAGAMALELRLTVYDTLYLALAQKSGTGFVTADRKLFERVRPTARYGKLVTWVGDI